MSSRIARQYGNGILYEDTLLGHAEPALFEASTWPAAPVAPGYSGGRGATRFIQQGGQSWVLRHYYRGGAMRHIVADRFLWLGEERTRCFREWRLLAHLQELGLPAPRPVAARYRRHGLTYTADLLTVRIPDVETFARRLACGPAAPDVWETVGQCISDFHRAGVFHADLNAHNLQIDGSNHVFLLDFDRGCVMRNGGTWRQANLARLHRSLSKISADGTIGFTPREWRWLLDGYDKAR